MLYPLSYGGSGAGTTLPAGSIARETGARGQGLFGLDSTLSTCGLTTHRVSRRSLRDLLDQRGKAAIQRAISVRGGPTSADSLGRVTPEQVSDAVVGALQALADRGELTLPDGVPHSVTVERPRQEGHGDYASNVALQLAKKAGTNPRAWLS